MRHCNGYDRILVWAYIEEIFIESVQTLSIPYIVRTPLTKNLAQKASTVASYDSVRCTLKKHIENVKKNTGMINRALQLWRLMKMCDVKK